MLLHFAYAFYNIVHIVYWWNGVSCGYINYFLKLTLCTTRDFLILQELHVSAEQHFTCIS